jgi:hypothetical protein
VSLPAQWRRRVLASAAGLGLAVGLAGCAAFNVPGLVGDKYREFSSDDDKVAISGSSRLWDASNNGREAGWDVARAAYRASPGRGTGAGTWALEWTKHRPTQLAGQDAHSLYLEVMGELGLPGLLMVSAALLLILGAFAYRARGPDRALFAALLAAGLAWVVHAGFDWDWEMPATTLWLFALGGVVLAARSRERSVPLRIAAPVKLLALAACAAVAILPLRMAVSEARIDESLEAIHHDDCAQAIAKARESLSAVGRRPLPYQVIGFCELRRGRPAAAARALEAAAERDPENWELRRDLAVALALAGRDPRPNAKLALRLKPREVNAQEVAQRFRRAAGPRRWRRAATKLAIHPPGPPTP